VPTGIALELFVALSISLLKGRRAIVLRRSNRQAQVNPPLPPSASAAGATTPGAPVASLDNADTIADATEFVSLPHSVYVDVLSFKRYRFFCWYLALSFTYYNQLPTTSNAFGVHCFVDAACQVCKPSMCLFRLKFTLFD
jgi:hypothetical protein